MHFSSHHHTAPDHDEQTEDRGGPHRRWRRRGGRHGGGPGRRGGRRHRARRGALRDGIIVLLGERPMHGYELITELETRSEGRWRPSPGAIYPALRKLEYHGLVTSSEQADDDDTDAGADRPKTFELTAEGLAVRSRIEAARAEGAPAPWDDTGPGEQGELRQLMAEISGQLRQIGRFGSDAQLAQTREILADTRTKLYAVLASADTEPGASTDSTD